MTPQAVAAVLQALVCLVTLSFFVPRLWLALTTLRHNRDGLLGQRVQQLLMSFAVLGIASWAFALRLDALVHPEPGGRWFSEPAERWEDAIVWALMLAAVSAYAWLYWREERR